MNKKVLKSIIMVWIVLLGINSYRYFNKIVHIQFFCLFHKITNLYCPGCGITRMILSLASGNIRQAFRYNMLLFISFILFLPYFAYRYNCWLKNKPYKCIPQNVWIILTITFVVYGIMRNIDLFSYLQPTILS